MMIHFREGKLLIGELRLSLIMSLYISETDQVNYLQFKQQINSGIIFLCQNLKRKV